MEQTITPAKCLKGEVTVPGDKSISHRAAMIGSISQGVSEVENYAAGQDCQRTIEAMRALGIQITEQGGKLVIHGRGLRGLKPPEVRLYAGNSGTTMRLLAGILAGQDFESVITGDQYLNRRPMRRIIEPLRLMGVEITGVDDQYPPLKIRGGKLKPIQYQTPIPSAQVKSAILLAGLYADGKTTVIEKARSRDHTERMLKAGGAKIDKRSSEKGLQVSVTADPRLSAQRTTVPGDISSAAFFIVAAAILPDSQLLIRDVGLNPTRCGIIDAIRRMGGKIVIQNQRQSGGEPIGDIIVRGSELSGISIEGDLIPNLIDEIPVLAVAATQARGETVIRDAEELRKKETDRISAVVANLRRIGAQVQEFPDGMVIEGGRVLCGAEIESFGDHRIGMAFAVAGLFARGETTIYGWEWTETSFPGFLEKLDSLRRG